MAKKAQDKKTVLPRDIPSGSAPDLVAMTRDLAEDQHGPTTAHVHPDEVDNFISAGWQQED